MTIYAAIFLIHFRKNVFDEIFFLMELLYITNDFELLRFSVKIFFVFQLQSHLLI